MTKQDYLQSVRAGSAYPVYRGFTGLIALLGYCLAGIVALTAVIGGLSSMGSSVLRGLGVLIFGGIVAAILFLIAKLSKEAALMLVDIADSTIDANSRLHSSLPR